MKKLFFLLGIIFSCISIINAQSDRWQQRIKYLIDVDVNVTTNQFVGTEKIEYINNSPDTLSRIFFHMYWNAFQPNSMMDVRSRELGQTVLGTNRRGDPILDWDSRVRDRILNLKENEIGYQRTKNVLVNGKEQKLIEHETILEVVLDKPILPKSKTNLLVNFVAQVPLQVRRSGRDNAEGVRYSMSQWYPKIVEYDYQGWNANPYIAREFYGVWGDYNVNISIDKSYMIASTGTLQNANKIGFGYENLNEKVNKPTTEKLTWNFVANNVHDFVWAADPDFAHDTAQVPGGPLLHFIYQKNQDYGTAWKDMQPLMVKAFDFMSKNFGVYPYPQYSFIQGGDGGMEYPMATLITGNRKLPSLVGVSVHEAAHSWYQGVLATNESLYAWMDEGFTSYATQETMDYLFKQGMPGSHKSAYADYFSIVQEGKEEALDTHADHFVSNNAYGTAAYSKGEVYLAQLEYIVGKFHFRTSLLTYFNTWKFKHPDCYDFIRVLEKQSGMELDWYNEYFVNTTKTIDYGIAAIEAVDNKTTVTLTREGLMPMPLDVEVVYEDNTYETFYIPLDIMRGEKPADGYNGKWTVMQDWKWVVPTYELIIPQSYKKIKSITIDPSWLMADVDKSDNVFKMDERLDFFWRNK